MRSKPMNVLSKVLATTTALAMLAGCGSKPAETKPPQPSGGTPAPAQTPAPAPAKKNATASIAMWSPPNNFHALNTDSNYGFFAIEIMFDTLMATNDKGDYVPKLAEKWEVSPDFTTYTFHLNKKAKWHDGKPVTAKDVAYTLNTIVNKETVTNRSANVNILKGTDDQGKAPGPIEGVKVVDDYTVQLITKQPVDPLSVYEKISSSMRIVPEHILGSTPLKDLHNNPFWMQPTVGNGPFKFVKYATDQYIEYTRNDDYYLGQPKLEKLFLKIMPATNAVAALEKGEIDVTAGPGIGEIPITDWDKVKTLPNVQAVDFVSKGYQYMEFNHQRAYFKKPEVRQAFYYAINRKLIVDNLLKGNGAIIDAPYTPIFKYVNKDLKIREFDSNKAKEMLTAAGWDFNQKLLLVVPLGNKVREQSADIIMANLQQIGVKVEIQKMDFPTMQARRKDGDFDMALVGWSSGLDPDVAAQFKTGMVYNQSGFSNAKIDELLDKGALTADFTARKKVYDEFQVALYNDPAIVFLYSPNGLTAVAKRMINVKQSAFGPAWNLQEWDVTE